MAGEKAHASGGCVLQLRSARLAWNHDSLNIPEGVGSDPRQDFGEVGALRFLPACVDSWSWKPEGRLDTEY